MAQLSDPGGGSASTDPFSSLKVLDPAYYQQKLSDYQQQAAAASAAGQNGPSPDSPGSQTFSQRFAAWVEAHPGEAVLIGVAALFAASKL